MTITITEAKQLIERAQHDVESILRELQRATGLRVSYVNYNITSTNENGTENFNIYISTSIV